MRIFHSVMADRLTKEVLQKNWGLLKDDVKFDDVSSGLIENDLISVDDNTRIKTIPVEKQSERMEEVLTLLYKTNKSDWNIRFLRILETKGYSHIARKLQGMEPTSHAQVAKDQSSQGVKITPEEYGAFGSDTTGDAEAPLLKEVRQEIRGLKHHFRGELKAALKEAMKNVPTNEDIRKRDRQIANLERRLKDVDERLTEKDLTQKDYQALVKEKIELEDALSKARSEIEALKRENKEVNIKLENLKEENLKKSYKADLKKYNR